MNREIDFRTDYYSLGITFFQLLTASLPFEAEDAIGWVHAHLAMTPPNPCKINRELPPTLGELVLKLMSKNAESRYQSATGLLNDLEECQRQWVRNGNIESFTLGLYDVANQFVIPQKLYGRDKQIDQLQRTFKTTSKGSCEFLVVSGYPGIGKTALISELQKSISDRSGFLIKGKCERTKRNIPHSALSEALENLALLVMTRPNREINKWRSRLKEVLGVNGQIIIDLAPSFSELIGNCAPLQSVNPNEARNRFIATFQAFLNVFATAEHPMIIALDDLQWCDIPTLNLIISIMATNEISHLLVIGGYRQNEVNEGHPLSIAIGQIERTKWIHKINLEPLEIESISQILMDAFNCENSRALALGEVVRVKTDGNPFFIIEMLKNLVTKGDILFDSEQRKWHWDLTQIRSLGLSDNVVDLVVEKLRQMPQSTVDTLMIAACLGNQFDLSTLSIIAGVNHQITARRLWEAVTEGIITPLDDTYRIFQLGDEDGDKSQSDHNVSYVFQHDRVQQAAYSLADLKSRAKLHYDIGMVLLKKAFSGEEHDVMGETALEIVRHLNEGVEYVVQESDKIKLAELNLKAAQASKLATAFDPALQYLKIGDGIMSNNAWDSNHQLKFDLKLGLMESAYMCGEFKLAEETGKILLKRAKNKNAKALIEYTRFVQLISRARMRDAINVGIESLSYLGIKVTTKVGKAEILKEYLLTRSAIFGKSTEALINAPEMKDQTKRLIAKILIEFLPVTYLTGRINLFMLVVFKLIRLAVRYGNTPEISFAYSMYAQILSAKYKKLPLGKKMGLLALELAEKYGDLKYKCRTSFSYGCFVHYYSFPWGGITDYLDEAINAGLQSGDQLYVSYAAVNAASFDPTLTLVELCEKTTGYMAIIEETGLLSSLEFLRVVLQTSRNLMGLTEERFSLSDEHCSERECIKRMTSEHIYTGIALYYMSKMKLAYLYEDLDKTDQELANLRKVFYALNGLPWHIEGQLFIALSLGKKAQGDKAKSREVINEVKKISDDMALLTKHNRTNFAHFDLIVQATLAELKGQAKVQQLLESAIAHAKTHRYIFYEALANELLAKYHISTGNERLAKLFFADARFCYAEWGAAEKIKQLDEMYAEFMPIVPATGKLSTSRHASSDGSLHSSIHAGDSKPGKDSFLDFGTIIKTAHAISSQVKPDKLLELVIQALIENAGAETGFLIFPKHDLDELIIEAEGRLDRKRYIANRRSVTESTEICQAIVFLVARTRKLIVLDDAENKGNFVNDHYIKLNKVKSLLCMPIHNQGALTGLVYLENNQDVGIFNDDRIEILNMLASHAAVSIENAQLYADLEKRVVDRTAELNRRSRETADILDAIDQGIFTINRDFSVNVEHSKQAELLFGKTEFAELSLQTLLGLTNEQVAIFRNWFDAATASDTLSFWSKMSSLAPLNEIQITIGDEQKTVTLDYKPIIEQGSLVKLLILGKDVTREREAEKKLREAEAHDQIKIALVINSISSNQDLLIRFLTNATRLIENYVKPESGKEVTNDYQKTLRELHTLKGDSGSFGFIEFSDIAGKVESVISKFLNPETPVGDLDENLWQNAVSELKDALERIKMMRRKLKLDQAEGFFIDRSQYDNLLSMAGRQETTTDQLFQEIRQLDASPMSKICEKYNNVIQQYCGQTGKAIHNLVLADPDQKVHREVIAQFDSSLVHIIRNAIDHGIESEKQRNNKGKSAGTITLTHRSLPDRYVFEVQDDGAGIDTNKVVQKAIIADLVSKAEANAMNEQEKLALIFRAGFSTKDVVTKTSGRGAGLDYVMTEMQNLGGGVEIKTKKNEGTTFIIWIPKKAFAAKKDAA